MSGPGSRRGEEHQRYEKRLAHKTRVKEKEIGVDSYTIQSREVEVHDSFFSAAHERKCRSFQSGPSHEEKVRTQIHVDPKRIFDLAPRVLSRRDTREEFTVKGTSKELMEKKNNEIDNIKGKVAGLVILCNKRTKSRILSYQAFEIPLHRKSLLDKICFGLKLFFYEVEERELFGIFEVIAYGARETASKVLGESAYSAVVQFQPIKISLPLHEFHFQDVVWGKSLEGDDVTVDLSLNQVMRLMQLFELAEAPPRNLTSSRTTHSFPAISASVSLIDFQPLELFPTKYAVEGSQLSRKELSAQAASKSIRLNNENSLMYADTISLPNYLQESHKTECLNSGEGVFEFKTSLDVLPSGMKDTIRGRASEGVISGHSLFSSGYKRQTVFDGSAADDKTSLIGKSLCSDRAVLDVKGNVDSWNSTPVTRVGGPVNLPYGLKGTETVSNLPTHYPDHQSSQNDVFDERQFNKIHSSKLSRFNEYEGLELGRAYGYGRESSLSRNVSFPISTGRSFDSDIVDAHGAKDGVRRGDGILKSHGSTSFPSSRGICRNTAIQIPGTEHVSLPATACASHLLRVAQNGSPVNNRDRDLKSNERIATLPLEHVYSSKLRKLKTDSMKRTSEHFPNGHHLVNRVKNQRKGISPTDEAYVRLNAKEKSQKLMPEPHNQFNKLMKAEKEDTHDWMSSERLKKQRSSSLTDEKQSLEDKRKYKRSVWSRLSGFGTSQRGEFSQENLDSKIMDPSFVVDHKSIKSSSDVSDRHASDVAEELNVDFTFSENAFLVDFKRRNNKLPSQEKHEKVSTTRGASVSQSENSSEIQKQKRRKLVRSEV